MKKKSILVLSLLIVMSATLAVPAFACPQENKLVIDVTYGIINEEDPGVCSWYWALDNRVVHLRVWQLPGDANLPYNYLAEETSFGSFYVPKGAPQVIDWLTLQVRSGYGVMKTYDSWIILWRVSPCLR
ncbi:MAG: hypothetical protein NTY03_00385 [Candidatus Bathyarchaeota archaeon]|nr:hypothetical protein [Candidatus Bathyarchaeota archaeon]